MSHSPSQTPGQSRCVYSIQTLLRFGQKAGCLGLHTLRLSPDIPGAQVLKFANMERSVKAEHSPARQKSDADQYVNVKNSVRFKSATDLNGDNRPRFNPGLEIQIPAMRQPDNPPFSESLQRVMGFAKFLKAHTSPQDKRVTAGGRIVPVGPKSPPPTFQVEHLDTVLRTAEKSQRQLEVVSEFASEQKKHPQDIVCSEQQEQTTSPSAARENTSEEDELQYQNFGWLKLDKSFRLLEQLSPGTAIVKLGASIFHASSKGPGERVHFQTVTVKPSQPTPLTTNTNFQVSSSAPGKILPDAPMLTDQVGGDYHSHPMFPQHNCSASVGHVRPEDFQVSYLTPAAVPLSEFGNMLPNYTKPAGHHHEWTNSSSSHAKYSDDLLNNRFSAIPMDTWSIDTLSALRTATEAYMQACSFLKEHEKYTALNESHMSAQELQFAIEKKRHLILARDACRRRKDSLEAMQAEQLQRLRDLEAQHLDHWQTQQLPHISYDGASIQGPPQIFGSYHPSSAPKSGTTTNSANQKPAHLKTPAQQSQKSLSPRAPEFVPMVGVINSPVAHRDEKPHNVSLAEPNAEKAHAHPPSEESRTLTISAHREKTANISRSITADEVRQALQNSEKGPMQLEQEAAQRAKGLRDDSNDPYDANRAKFYVAAQARRSEKSVRRSKLSTRGSITESACKSFVDLATQQTGVIISSSSGATKTDKHKVTSSQHNTNVLDNVGKVEDLRNSKSKHDEAVKLLKKGKNHVRFGIDECIAAFEASGHRAGGPKAALDRTATHNEPGNDQTLSHTLSGGKSKTVRERTSSQVRGKDVAAEVEERILHEQQKIATPGNEHPGFKMGASSPSTHLATNVQGSHIYPSAGAKVKAGKVHDHRANTKPFSLASPAATSLRSSLANMESRLRGGLLGAGEVTSTADFYGAMDQSNDTTPTRRLDLGRINSGALNSNHINGWASSYQARSDSMHEHTTRLPAMVNTGCDSSEDHCNGPYLNVAVHFPMADPSQLPLSIYREPYRPYTPGPEGMAARLGYSSFPSQ